MIQKLTIFAAFLTFFSLEAQGAFFSAGKNFTVFNFTNSEGVSNLELEKFAGSYFEAGGIISLRKLFYGLSYAPSVSLMEYNSQGGSINSTYSWQANHLSLNNSIKYNFLENSNLIDFSVLIGISVSSLINGNQTINGSVFNLSKDREFNGFWYRPFVGSELVIFPTSDIGIGIGYGLSKVYSGNYTTQVLSFSNQQIQFILVLKTF